MRNRSEVIANSLARGTLRAGSNTILPGQALLKWDGDVAARVVAGSETLAGFKRRYAALNADTAPAERVRRVLGMSSSLEVKVLYPT